MENKKRGRPRKNPMGHAINQLKIQGLETMLNEASEEGLISQGLSKEQIECKTVVKLKRLKTEDPFILIFRSACLRLSKDKDVCVYVQVLFFLLGSADYGGWVHAETQQALGESIGRTRKQVNFALKRLQRKGYITVFQAGHTHTYKVRIGDIGLNPDYFHKGPLSDKNNAAEVWKQQKLPFPELQSD